MHRDAERRFFEREHVVHAIAHHRHPLAVAHQRIHQLVFLFRLDPSEDGGLNRSLIKFCWTHRLELGAGNKLDIRRKPRLFGKRCHRSRVVPRDDFELNAELTKGRDRFLGLWT